MVQYRELLLRVWPGGLHLDCFASNGAERETGDEACGRPVEEMWMQETVLFQLIKLRCRSDCFAADGPKFTSQGGRSVTSALGMKRDDVMRFPPGLVHAWLRVVGTFLKARALCV